MEYKVAVIFAVSILELFLLEDTVEAVYDDYETTHTRQWTSWYNTDTPRNGGVDDESIISIRQRGFAVCDGNEPLDAICRVTTDPKVLLFNEHTTHFTTDKLFLPCSIQGVICRDIDQDNHRNCSDYSVRFECLIVHKQDRSQNLGIIAIAAGLSVVVPILCVLVMHVMRLMKERRNPGQPRRGSMSSAESQEALNQDQGIQTELGDAPPSYDQLFGGSFGSTDTLLGSTFPPSTEIENNTNANISGVSSSSQNDPVDRVPSPTGSVFSVSDGQLDPISIASIQTENEIRTPQHLHLPGMHISVFDLMTSQNDIRRTSRTSLASLDSLSYIQTPPPTYKDALALFGLSNNEKNDGDVNYDVSAK